MPRECLATMPVLLMRFSLAGNDGHAERHLDLEQLCGRKRKESWRAVDSLELIDDEQCHLRARNVVLQADCAESEIRLDGRLRARAVMRPAPPAIRFGLRRTRPDGTSSAKR